MNLNTQHNSMRSLRKMATITQIKDTLIDFATIDFTKINESFSITF